MTAMIMTLEELTAEAEARLRAQAEPEYLLGEYGYWFGVLGGYYYAGAVSNQAVESIRVRLRTLYYQCFAPLDPKAVAVIAEHDPFVAAAIAEAQP